MPLPRPTNSQPPASQPFANFSRAQSSIKRELISERHYRKNLFDRVVYCNCRPQVNFAVNNEFMVQRICVQLAGRHPR